MKSILVRATGAQTKKVVFDQEGAGVQYGQAVRAVIRANGKAYEVDGSNELVKAAIKRGDLVSLEPIEESTK